MHNGNNYASWNWIGAGTAPSNTYAVKVVSDTVVTNIDLMILVQVQ